MGNHVDKLRAQPLAAVRSPHELLARRFLESPVTYSGRTLGRIVFRPVQRRPHSRKHFRHTVAEPDQYCARRRESVAGRHPSQCATVR